MTYRALGNIFHGMHYKKISLLFYCVSISLLLHSQLLLANIDNEMGFKVAEVCDQLQNCKVGLIANGTVTSRSTPNFLRVVSESPRPLTVFLNGKGNDLLSGISLGKAIRAKGFATQAGLITELKSVDDSNIKYSIKDGGECVSACLLALLGGNPRATHPNDFLGFYKLTPAQNEISEAKTRAATAEYLKNMGVNVHTLDYLSNGKNDEIHRIPYAIARKLNIDTEETTYATPWRIKTTSSGQVIGLISETDSQANISVTLALVKPISNDEVFASGNLRLIVFIKPLKGAFSPKEIAKVISKPSALTIRANGFSINDLNVRKWEQYQEGIQTFVVLPIQSIDQIAAGRFFDLTLPQLDNLSTNSTIRYSTEGLKSTIAAIKK